MRNEPRVTSPIAVRDFAAKDLADRAPLFVVKALGRDECDFDPQVGHRDISLLRMFGDVRQRRRVAKQHAWLDAANGGNKTVKFRL